MLTGFFSHTKYMDELHAVKQAGFNNSILLLKTKLPQSKCNSIAPIFPRLCHRFTVYMILVII